MPSGVRVPHPAQILPSYMLERKIKRRSLLAAAALPLLAACGFNNESPQLIKEPIQDIDEEIEKLVTHESIEEAKNELIKMVSTHNDLSIKSALSSNIEATASHLKFSTHSKVQKAYVLTMAYGSLRGKNSVVIAKIKDEREKTKLTNENLRLQNEISRLQSYTDRILYK
jgi:hypothetical protein